MFGFMNQSIQRERPKMVDDGRGNKRPDFTGVTPVSISGCSIQPGGSAEDVQNRQGTRIAWSVYISGHADVHYLDRITVGGQKYRIIGEPELWPSPTGMLDSTKLLLERWVN